MKSRPALAILFLIISAASLLAAPITLPPSRRVAGPLNSLDSTFGDEFYNFPPMFGGRAAPGKTHLSGWIEFRFDEPEGRTASFTFQFDGAGSDDGILFPGGQIYQLLGNRAFSNPLLVNRGKVNLDTGEVTDLEVHAIFQNSVISRVTRNIRIPFGFLNDYPPADPPMPLPFSDRPPVFETASFTSDSSGKITGFEFRGETISPVTLFPQLGLFPIYSFGEEGRFYFANPDGCLPGTPPQNCPTADVAPDGVLLPSNAFFHPHFELITSELAEKPATSPTYPSLPSRAAGGAGLVAVGEKLYQLGGYDGSDVTLRVQVYDAASNRWSETAPLPEAAFGGQSATIGSRIYVVGGWDGRRNNPVKRMQILETQTGRWAPAKPPLLAVAGGAAAAAGGRLFVFGGWSQDAAGAAAPTDAVQIYDPAGDAWIMGPALPSALSGLSAVLVGSDIYCINGRTAEGALTNRVFILDTRTLQWSEGPRTLRAIYDGAAGLVGQRIYLAGGRLSVDGPADDGRMQILELSRNEWRDGHATLLPVAGAGAASIQGKLFLAGGWLMARTEVYPGSPTRALQIYDPAFGWLISGDAPFFTSGDVLNSAGGAVGPTSISPGSRAVILGYNLAAATAAAPPIRFERERFTSDLPETLQGVRIRVEGVPCPIVSVAPDRVEFQVPYRLRLPDGGPRRATLTFSRDSAPSRSHSVEVNLAPAAPGIYLYSYGEQRNARYLTGATTAARNTDGRWNHPSRPAHPGETVTLFVTGLGLIRPLPEDGQHSFGDSVPEAVGLPQVTIGGKPARLVSARLQGGEAGIFEVKVVVPADSTRGNNVPLEVKSYGVSSNAVMISVR